MENPLALVPLDASPTTLPTIPTLMLYPRSPPHLFFSFNSLRSVLIYTHTYMYIYTFLVWWLWLLNFQICFGLKSILGSIDNMATGFVYGSRDCFLCSGWESLCNWNRDSTYRTWSMGFQTRILRYNSFKNFCFWSFYFLGIVVFFVPSVSLYEISFTVCRSYFLKLVIWNIIESTTIEVVDQRHLASLA